MGPMIPVREDVDWFRIDEAATAGTVRRAAIEAGQRLGLPEGRLGEIAIAVTEIAVNLHKHADDGSLLLRTVVHDGVGGLEIVAIDAGPGMDVSKSRDGYSTAGTLGLGLGAIERLASTSDMYSYPGRGTVLAAQFWPKGHEPDPVPAAGLTRPITGEKACGDRFAVRPTGYGLLAMMSDGLGHGPLAAAASQAAEAAFTDADESSPAAVVEAIHRRIGHTRGAAIAVVAVDGARGTVRFAGLGNISGHVVSRDGPRRTMASLPGIAGHNRRTVREFDYELPPEGLVVLHSDGLTDRWDLTTYPGLRWDPTLVAAVLLRDAGIRRDDAGVLVLAADE
jgi:anti-sigma regulatory factor (Ser/Thr protein kinase)